MIRELFGNVGGKDVYLYTLENTNGMKVTVCNYGALIISIDAPDKDGNCVDVALGYDSLERYLENGCYYGAVIGPNANRIGDAKYTLNGVTYQLDVNDGKNNLHSHADLGVHKRVWEANEIDNGILFTLQMKDGELGFNGNKTFHVFYGVTPDNGLVITYDADSDQDTIINLTNHNYFNLDGHGAGSIESHKLQLLASAYTPADEGSIPYGDILTVEGTPMDFTEMQVIGDRIDADFVQLQQAGGYDHNWVCNNFDGSVRKIAVVKNASETRTMEVYTDLPGVQFYAGNFLKPDTGKGGAKYDKRCALALETQFYPDTANKPQFPSAVFGPARHYHTTTIYKFV